MKQLDEFEAFKLRLSRQQTPGLKPSNSHRIDMSLFYHTYILQYSKFITEFLLLYSLLSPTLCPYPLGKVGIHLRLHRHKTPILKAICSRSNAYTPLVTSASIASGYFFNIVSGFFRFDSMIIMIPYRQLLPNVHRNHHLCDGSYSSSLNS